MKSANDYLKDRPFIHGNYATQGDLDDFNYLNKRRDIVLASDYSHLVEWYFKMNEMLQKQDDLCKVC